jgi:hypothetical protein
MSGFSLQCNTNYPGGAAYGNPDVVDLFKVWVPDMASCINQCAMYNQRFEVTSGASLKCAVVGVARQAGDYCWLKSATGINNTDTSGAGVPIDSAVLINS